MKITLLKLSQVRTDDINAATTVDFDEQIKKYTKVTHYAKNITKIYKTGGDCLCLCHQKPTCS